LAEVENVAVETENMTDAELDTALQGTDDTPIGSTEPEKTESEPAPAPTGEETAEPKPDKMVPHGALHEERMKRKNAEAETRRQQAELAQLRQTMQVGNERLQQLLQRITPQEQVPDPNTDPVGHLAYSQQKLSEQVDGLGKTLEQERNEVRQREQVQQFVGAVKGGVQEFVKQTPDYQTAYEFARDSRLREHIASGMTEEQAIDAFANDERHLALGAMQRGENPAAVTYRIAQARGYVPAAKKMEMQQRGQAAAKPTGSVASGKISLEALANMSNDEFDAIAGDNKQWRKLMGG
jgi:hypothetical protein